METWDAIRARRNVRVFAERPIADADLDRILEAGRRAPSSRNWQPWDFVLVTDRAQLAELAKVWRGAAHVARRRGRDRLPRPGASTTRRQNGWLQYDHGQATMSMALAAADLGIGTSHAAVARSGARALAARLSRGSLRRLAALARLSRRAAAVAARAGPTAGRSTRSCTAAAGSGSARRLAGRAASHSARLVAFGLGGLAGRLLLAVERAGAPARASSSLSVARSSLAERRRASRRRRPRARGRPSASTRSPSAESSMMPRRRSARSRLRTIRSASSSSFSSATRLEASSPSTSISVCCGVRPVILEMRERDEVARAQAERCDGLARTGAAWRAPAG